jgi:hypothetical protein
MEHPQPAGRSLREMDIYNLAKVDATRDGARGTSLHGFNIIGIDGRPLVTFSFETLAEAQEAHKAMQAIVPKMKLITPHVGR